MPYFFFFLTKGMFKEPQCQITSLPQFTYTSLVTWIITWKKIPVIRQLQSYPKEWWECRNWWNLQLHTRSVVDLKISVYWYIKRSFRSKIKILYQSFRSPKVFFFFFFLLLNKDKEEKKIFINKIVTFPHTAKNNYLHFIQVKHQKY